MDVEEDEAYDENTEGDSSGEGQSEFAAKWGWTFNVETVANTTHVSWNEVWEMNLIEFLNILSYCRDKAAWEKEEQKKWQKKH